MAAKIKKGDKVVVLTGRDKGKTGEVLKIVTDANRAIVAGVNLVKNTKSQVRRVTAALSRKRLPST